MGSFATGFRRFCTFLAFTGTILLFGGCAHYQNVDTLPLIMPIEVAYHCDLPDAPAGSLAVSDGLGVSLFAEPRAVAMRNLSTQYPAFAGYWYQDLNLPAPEIAPSVCSRWSISRGNLLWGATSSPAWGGRQRYEHYEQQLPRNAICFQRSLALVSATIAG